MAININAIRSRGVDIALFRIERQIKNIGPTTLKGQITSGLLIQGGAQRNTPVDTGNLRASAFTVWARKRTGDAPKFRGKDAAERRNDHEKVVAGEKSQLSQNPFKPSVEVGFSAAYALPVHEDMNAKHNVGHAQFLRLAIVQNSQAIVDILRQDVVRGIDGNPVIP